MTARCLPLASEVADDRDRGWLPCVSCLLRSSVVVGVRGRTADGTTGSAMTDRSPSALSGAATQWWQAKCSALEAERDRYRAALELIATAGERVPDWRAMVDCARAALDQQRRVPDRSSEEA